MSKGNSTHQPWGALKSLLSAPATRASTRYHPKRTVLRAYLAENLPERPAAWTRERAEALASGTLEEWTRLEVAAHAASCSRCRKRIDALEQSAMRMLLSRIGSLRHVLRQPKWAPVGWALAGTQAAALASLLLWTVFSPSPVLLTQDPLIDLSLNQVSQNEVFLQAPSVWVEFEPSAPWEEVTTWLQLLELEILGPDAEGRYLLLGKAIETDEIAQSPWVLRIESVGGDDEE